MPQTLDPGPLGLDHRAVEEEERRREQERQRSIIDQRSIDFGGIKLDTGEPSFAESFRQLAENSINPTSPTQRELCRFSLFSTTQVIELLNLCTPNSPQYCL